MVTSNWFNTWVPFQRSASDLSYAAYDRDVELLALEPEHLECGDRGSAVVVLQVTLQQLKFYSQEITGQFDERTADAVRALQAYFGLEVSGKFDPATWYALTFWLV